MKFSSIVFCLLLACLMIFGAGIWLHDGAAAANPPSFATANQITHDGLLKTAVLSDGSSLYIAEEKDGHQVIAKIDPATGKESTVAAPFADVRAIDVSPRSEEFAGIAHACRRAQWRALDDPAEPDGVVAHGRSYRRRCGMGSEWRGSRFGERARDLDHFDEGLGWQEACGSEGTSVSSAILA
jgi:hypothetical protein